MHDHRLPDGAELSDCIAGALALPGAAIPYELDRRLRRLYAGRFVFRSSDRSFDVGRFANAGLCEIEPRDIDVLCDHHWYEQTHEHVEIGAFRASWESHSFELVVVSYSAGFG